MRKLILLVALFTLVIAPVSDARIMIKGRGAKMNFDPDSIPAQYRASFDLMTRKCSKCHTMERTVIAVLTGRAPITGQPFDRQAVKAYAIKMLRKPDSNMNKQEIRDVAMLLNFLLGENAK